MPIVLPRAVDFLARLQALRVTPSGEIHWTEFADTVAEAVTRLSSARKVVVFRVQPLTQEFEVLTARGLSPEATTALRVRPGEGLLGQAAQSSRALWANGVGSSPAPGLPEENFLVAPYGLLPLTIQSRLAGLVALSDPSESRFSASSMHEVSLVIAAAGMTLENLEAAESLEDGMRHHVESLARALAVKDAYSHEHSHRTRQLSCALALELPLPKQLVRYIEYGALLHDLGKIGVSDDILTNPGSLTAEEYAKVKKHPAYGQEILHALPEMDPVSPIVHYHHEWFNGEGYPEGLAREEIPLGARLVAVVDAWDAMTSDRSYRQAMPKPAAIAELRRQAGTQFDPKLVDAFLRLLERLEREGVPTTEKEYRSPSHG